MALTQATVLAFIKGSDKFVTSTTIANALNTDVAVVRNILKHLYTTGKIDRMVRVEGTDTPVGWYGIRDGIAPGTALRNSKRTA